MKTTTPFDFPFNPGKDADLQAVRGYQKALHEMYLYIAELTAWKPANRFIDAAALLDKIQATNDEKISPFLNEAGLNLERKLVNY